MKKNITLLSIVLLSVLTFGQENPGLVIIPSKIGFESGEGYTLGDIDNQEGWKVLGHVYREKSKRNVVTDELSNNGNHSLKLAYDKDIPYQQTIGVNYFMPKTDKNIELYISFLMGLGVISDYRIIITPTEENALADILFFNKEGSISIRDLETGNDIHTNAFLTPSTWYKLNIVYNKQERRIEYKLDDEVFYTRRNVNSVNFGYNQIEFLHDNTGLNSAMYLDDLFFYENSSLSTLESDKNKSKISVYPNPTTNFITIQNIEGNVEQITLGDFNGRTVRNIKATDRKVDLQGLSNGIYLLKIKTDKGLLIEKIIKK